MRSSLLIAAVAAAGFVLPAGAAMARSGYVTSNLNLHAGPSLAFPVVDTIPDGSRVNIHGCLSGYAWCDVGWNGERGWVDGDYLQFLYRGRRVLIVTYGDEVDFPIVAFSVGTYWRHHYRHRGFYGRLGYWQRHYRHHRPHRGHGHHAPAHRHHRHNVHHRHNGHAAPTAIGHGHRHHGRGPLVGGHAPRVAHGRAGPHVRHGGPHLRHGGGHVQGARPHAGHHARFGRHGGSTGHGRPHPHIGAHVGGTHAGHAAHSGGGHRGGGHRGGGHGRHHP